MAWLLCVRSTCLEKHDGEHQRLHDGVCSAKKYGGRDHELSRRFKGLFSESRRVVPEEPPQGQSQAFRLQEKSAGYRG